MAGLASLEKRAFLGAALRMVGRQFNPFATKMTASGVLKNTGIGIGLTIPFSNTKSAVTSIKQGGMHVW